MQIPMQEFELNNSPSDYTSELHNCFYNWDMPGLFFVFWIQFLYNRYLIKIADDWIWTVVL